MLMIESRFSVLGTLGALTTMMKSYSAFGPSLRVIRLVSSLETGFSMNQASCLTSLFEMVSFSDLSPDDSIEKGS